MTDADKLNRVINSLEFCLKGLSDLCPYRNSDAPGGCRDELMYDAMTMLEKQKAKIISLNEADKLPYVWLESDQGGLGLRRVRIVPEDSTAVGIMAFGLQTTFHEASIFEKHFRCWSEKPTDEQRKAVKWDD